jgi:proteasome accessory factor B
MTLQSGQGYNVDGLSRMLGTSRRTIFRDLTDLRKATVPLYYNRKGRRYSIDQKFFMPPTELSEQEALSLLILAHKAKDHIHTPSNGLAMLAALKIENNLPPEIKRYCNAVLENISVKPYPPTRAKFLDKIFYQLHEAVLKKRMVKIGYYLPGEQKSQEAELCPYHLIYNDHSWYVIGRIISGKMCTFRLNQIEKLDVLEKCFVEEKEFNVQECIGKAWGVEPQGKLYNVKLKFLAEAAYNVAEVQWHSTQQVTFNKDGSAIVEFRVDGLDEMVSWILSFGDKVKIISPDVLRQRIVEMARHTAEQNEQISAT